MRIAYFTPLSPQHSGIADFAEELLPELAHAMDVDVFSEAQPGNAQIKRKISVYPIAQYEKLHARQQYDYAIYQLGNNIDYHKSILLAFLNYGGILELHDLSLHNMIAADTIGSNKVQDYLDLMQYCHGHSGRKAASNYIEGRGPAPWEKSALRYTMVKHLVDKSQGVIVHSDLGKQLIKGISPDIPVCLIHHHTNDIVNDIGAFQESCRDSLGLPKDQLIIGSFGYATDNKRILSVCKALAQFRPHRDMFHYYIVGENNIESLPGYLQSHNLTEHVTIVGYTELDVYKKYMGACDFAINLRYPTHGESSGSLHRLFGFGKPVVVTDIGTFQEYPEEFTIKVGYEDNEVGQVLSAIERYADRQETARCGLLAKRYAEKNFSLSNNARKYKDFMEILQDGWTEVDPIDRCIDRVEQLGLTSQEYVSHLAGKIGFLQ